MERLTGRWPCGLSNYSEGKLPEVIDRLVRIEDILGDDYDLDRLKDLVELEKNIPHVCRFCVGCEMEPKDGHGCDEYDSFVFSTRHLWELVGADRDGRCVVLPCVPSDVTVYQLRNKKHALGPGVHPRHVSCATVWANGRYQLEHQGYEPCRDKDFGKTWFLDEKAAEAALKGEKDG